MKEDLKSQPLPPGADSAALAEWLVQRNLHVTGNERLAAASHLALLRGIPVLVAAGEGVADLQTIALEEPQRHTGNIQFETLDSLIDYLKRHASPKRSSIYVSQCGATTGKNPALLTAVLVLDDHGPDTAGWKAWSGTLNVRLDPHAIEILERIRTEFTMDDLAAWIESNEAVFRDPDACKMLELATSFRANSTARFDKGRNLSNGDLRFEYVEETTATAGKTGEMSIPQVVTLCFPILVDGPAVEVTCRFRYRLQERRPLFTLFLPNLREILRTSSDELLADLRALSEGVPVYRGTLVD